MRYPGLPRTHKWWCGLRLRVSAGLRPASPRPRAIFSCCRCTIAVLGRAGQSTIRPCPNVGYVKLSTRERMRRRPRAAQVAANRGFRGVWPTGGARPPKPQTGPVDGWLRGEAVDYLRGWADVGYSGHVRARVERPRVKETARSIVQCHWRAEKGQWWSLDREPPVLEPFRDAQHEWCGKPVDEPDPARSPRVVAQPAAGCSVRDHRVRAPASPGEQHPRIERETNASDDRQHGAAGTTPFRLLGA